MLRTWERWRSRSRIAVVSTSSPARSSVQSRTLLLVVINDGATAVTVGYEAEEQAGFLAGHRIEADLVDQLYRFGPDRTVVRFGRVSPSLDGSAQQATATSWVC